jgi:dihydrodipicolinate synthase/N-acetylneuraminate lyase
MVEWMTMQITLPFPDGTLQPYTMAVPPAWPRPDGPPQSRVAYADAHVVVDPMADPAAATPALDWDATLRIRRRLWTYGMRVAEATDTAQRAMGLDWGISLDLVSRTAAAASDFGDPGELVVAGVGTDHAKDARDLDAVVSAYLAQLAAVRETGAGVVLLASRELAAVARGSDDYLKVYGTVLSQTDRPVILHWQGEMFDPRLTGYWGTRDIWQAAESVLQLVRENIGAIDGIKMSLLDPTHEVALRAALPAGVRLYTGDDFNYPALIASGSHALLGIFDAIAPAAAQALRALDAGDRLRYEEVFTPTVRLSRKIFEPPTYNYKTGLAFLAWLAGHQDAFVMVRGAQSARSLSHLAEVFRLADYAGLIPDPELAARRMTALMAQYGITA